MKNTTTPNNERGQAFWAENLHGAQVEFGLRPNRTHDRETCKWCGKEVVGVYDVPARKLVWKHS